MREFIAGSIGNEVPELRSILNKYSNMSKSEQKKLKEKIIENLKVRKYENENPKKKIK